MTHQIKINRAEKLSGWGKCPQTFAALLGHVPVALAARITGAELAMMIDALGECAQSSKALETREICEQGYVWDARRQRSRDLEV